MLPHTARPLTLGASSALAPSALAPTAAQSARHIPSARALHRNGAIKPRAPRVVLHLDALPEPTRARVEADPGFGACRPVQPQIVCADDSSCICPLSDHVTDAERAVMNEISRQASRLATALAWIFALVALASLVLLMLR